jgi:hypothetical protein
MAAVRLQDVDLFFRAKIEAMLAASGHRLATGEEADLVIADVNRCDPQRVVADAGATPVLGFGRHTDPALLRAARAAGFARVVPRSVLAERLPELIAEAVGYTGPGAESGRGV